MTLKKTPHVGLRGHIKNTADYHHWCIKAVSHLLLFVYLIGISGIGQPFLLCQTAQGDVHFEFESSGKCGNGRLVEKTGKPAEFPDTLTLLIGTADSDCRDVPVGLNHLPTSRAAALQPSTPGFVCLPAGESPSDQTIARRQWLNLTEPSPIPQTMTALQAIILLI